MECGVGHRLIVHLASGRVALDHTKQWAGATTRAYHGEIETIDAVKQIVDKYSA